jgi:nitrite reductase (NADH) large subunit
MRIVIVGNGLAGTMAAKTLRQADRSLDIDVFGAEAFPYYPRPNLIELLAGRMAEEKIFAFPPSWYEAEKIGLQLSSPVHRAIPESGRVQFASGRLEAYDVLLLAEGASPAVPVLPGIGRKGVFTLRTLDDARAILGRLQNTGPRAAVLGGGLLGLEIARALKHRGADVTVIEYFPHLLPRQLDPPGAAVLKKQIEAAGIHVRTGAAAEEILGDGDVRGVRLKSGETVPADLVLVAAGVRPNTDVARSAGVEVDKGVLVDDRMRTSRPGIFAAGDAIQHNGRLYGFIPAAFEQARTAAESILGGSRAYAGTVPANTLKVMGVALTSVGQIQPEKPHHEELRREVVDAGLYRKLVLDEGRLIGAIWMGDMRGVDAVVKAVLEKRDIAALKYDLLADDFDFKKL